MFLFLPTLAATHAGTWGYGSFENDAALDWVENYYKPDPTKGVDMAISAVAGRKAYLQANECCYVIAASEVLAAACGKPAVDLPEGIFQMAKKIPVEKVRSLLPTAQPILDAIVTDSELRELWEDSSDYEAWKKSVINLKNRLTP